MPAFEININLLRNPDRLELQEWLKLQDETSEAAVMAYLQWADVYGWEVTPDAFRKNYKGHASDRFEYVYGSDGRVHMFRKASWKI